MSSPRPDTDYDSLAKKAWGVTTPSKVGGYKPRTKTSGNPEFDNLYDEKGKQYDIDPDLLIAQGRQESSFRLNAKSPAGARGISQFMPGTAREFEVNPNDVGSSIDGQARLMRNLIDRTNDVDLALAGYNSGHNASINRLKRNKERIPETRNYVAKIGQEYRTPTTPAKSFDDIAKKAWAASPYDDIAKQAWGTVEPTTSIPTELKDREALQPVDTTAIDAMMRAPQRGAVVQTRTAQRPTKGKPTQQTAQPTAPTTAAFETFDIPLTKDSNEYSVDQEVANQIASKYGFDIDVVKQVLESEPTRFKSSTGDDISVNDYIKYQAGTSKLHQREVGASIIEKIRARATARKANEETLKIAREKVLSENTGLDTNPEMLDILAAKEAGFIGKYEAERRLAKSRDEYIDWLVAKGYAREDAVERAFGVKKEDGKPMSAFDWALAKNPLANLITGERKEDTYKTVRKNILDDIEQYGSLANATKAYKAQEEERKLSVLGQPTEALKTAARYITKIPSTIADTVAMATDLDPVTIGYEYVTGNETGVRKGLLDVSEQWRNAVDKDLALMQNPAYKSDFVANELAEGLAQFAVQMVGAPLTGGASLALPLMEGSTAQYREANKAGADRATRITASAVGAILAVPDVLLKAKYLKSLTGTGKLKFIENLTGGLFTKLAKKFGEKEAREITKDTVGAFIKKLASNTSLGFVGEYSQERLEDVGNKALAKATYKPELTWEEVILPSAQEKRGYLAAGIAGLFGGTVETTIEKLSNNELKKGDTELAKMLANERISQTNYERAKVALKKEIETRIKRGTYFAKDAQIQAEAAGAEAIDNFINEPTAESPKTVAEPKAEPTPVERKVDPKRKSVFEDTFGEEAKVEPKKKIKPTVTTEVTEQPVEKVDPKAEKQALAKLGYTVPVQKGLSVEEEADIVARGVRYQKPVKGKVKPPVSLIEDVSTQGMQSLKQLKVGQYFVNATGDILEKLDNSGNAKVIQSNVRTKDSIVEIASNAIVEPVDKPVIGIPISEKPTITKGTTVYKGKADGEVLKVKDGKAQVQWSKPDGSLGDLVEYNVGELEVAPTTVDAVSTEKPKAESATPKVGDKVENIIGGWKGTIAEVDGDLVVKRGKEVWGDYSPVNYTSVDEPMMMAVGSKQTDTPEFKKFFGKSKVVDEKGEPLVVYHGTKGDFDTFNTEFSADKQKAFYFTRDPRYAAMRAGTQGMARGSYFWENEVIQKPGVNVMPVFLSIQNPRTIQFSPRDKFSSPEIERSRIFDIKSSNKYDGAIFEKLNADGDVIDRYYVAFSPTQIKSAIGNRGTFDPNDPNILHKRPVEGSPEFAKATELANLPKRGEKFLEGVESTAMDGFIDLSPEAVEMGRVIDKAVGRSEGIRYGTTYTKAEAIDHIEGAKDLRQVLKDKGMSTKAIDKYIVDFEKVAKENQGIVPVGIEASRKHETLHGADLKSRIIKGETAKDLVVDGEIKQLKYPKLLKTFKQKYAEVIGRSVESISDNEAIAEAISYLGDGDHERFGLTQVQASKVLADIGIARFNSLVEAYDGDVEKAKANMAAFNIEGGEKIYEAIKSTDNGKGVRPSTESGQKRESKSETVGSSDVGNAETAGQGKATTEESDGVKLTSRTPGKSGLASDPEKVAEAKAEGQKVAAISKMLGIEDYYTPQGHEQTEANVNEILGEMTFDQAVTQAMHSTPSPEASRVLAREAQRLVGIAESYRQQGKPAEFMATLQRAGEIVGALKIRQIQTGREVEIQKMLEPLTPEAAVVTAEYLYQMTFDKPMSHAQRDEVFNLAKENQRLQGALATAEMKLAEQERIIAEIDNHVPEKKPFNHQEALLRKYQKRKPVLLAELKKKFPNSPAFQGDVMLMAVGKDTSDKADIVIDPKTAKLLEEYAIGQILTDRSYEAVIRELQEISGASEAQVKDIHARAANEVRGAKEPQTEEAKKRIKIRKEHYTEADKVSGKLDIKAIATARKSIKELQRKIDEGDLAIVRKRPVDSEKLAGLREQQKELRKTLANLRKANTQTVVGLSRYGQKSLDKNPEDIELAIAVDLLSNKQPHSIDSVILKLQNDYGFTPPEAKEIAQQAKQTIKDLKAEDARARDKAKGISDEQREIINQKRKEQLQAANRLNRFLSNVANNPTLIKRFNDDFRIKLVANWGTQIFNAVQVATVATPAQLSLDILELGLQTLGVKIGEQTELRARDLLLPYYYMFSANRQIAEQALANFPELFFDVHKGLLGDIPIEPLQLADTKNGLSKVAHKWFDINAKYNEFATKWSGAKMFEMHFRNSVIAAAFDQTIKKKTNGEKDLQSVMKEGKLREYITEENAKRAAKRAMDVTFASEIDDPVGIQLKRAYDAIDPYLPVLLNPVTYARFMYSTSKQAVLNPIFFGALDSKKLGGEGYSTRSIAKGLLAWSTLAAAGAILSALGGDDDKWYTIYPLGKDGPILDIRRSYPLAAYFYIAHNIKQGAEGKPLDRDVLGGLLSLETEYFQHGAPMEFIGAGWDVLSQKKGVDHLGKAGARVLGGYLSGIARVAKPLRDAWAQFDADERAYREDPESAKDKFLNEVSRSIPGVIRLSDQKKQTDIDGKVLEQPFPIGRIFGVNVVHPEFIREAGSKAEQWARRLWEKDYDKMSPEEKRAYTLRNQIKKAVRAGKMDAESASKRIDSYVKEGRLSEASATRLKNEMVMSPLEFKVKMEFSADKPDDIEKLKKVLSVATPEEKEALTKVLLKKSMPSELRKELGLNKVPSTGVDEMLNAPEMKKATTDDLVEIMKLEGYTAEEKAKVTQALLQKAGNALKSKTLTAEEIENIKTVLPDFKEDDAKSAQQKADSLDRKASNAERLQGANISDNLKNTLQSLGIPLPGFGDSLTPKKGGEKVKLTPEQQAKYERETLERIDAKIKSLQTQTNWKNASDAVKTSMIKGIIKKQQREEQKETKSEMLKAPKLADLAYAKDGGSDFEPRPIEYPDSPDKWKGQRLSTNIIDKRKGSKLDMFANLITGDIGEIRKAKFDGRGVERAEARRLLNEQIAEARYGIKRGATNAKQVLGELLKLRARF